MLYRWGMLYGIFCSSLFFSTFLLSHQIKVNLCLHKHSSKTLLTHPCALLQTLILPFYLWCWSEVCILLWSFCNSVSKSPEDSRLSEHHPAFWKLVILLTRLLGLIFTAFMICLSSTTVVSSANQVVVGCWYHRWFPNSWFLHALCFCYSSKWLPLFF